MRGPLISLIFATIALRIIPAYAGTTRRRTIRAVGRGDHPRLCGDHLKSSFVDLNFEGSSPPMRGPLYRGQLKDGAWRIIPAYAGTTAIQKNYSNWL